MNRASCAGFGTSTWRRPSDADLVSESTPITIDRPVEETFGIEGLVIVIVRIIGLGVAVYVRELDWHDNLRSVIRFAFIAVLQH